MKKNILNFLKTQFPWVGLRFISDSTQIFSSQDGKIKSPRQILSKGLQIEIRSRDLNHIGYAATSNFSYDSLLAAAKIAYEQAELQSQFGLHPLPLVTRPVSSGRFSTPQDKVIDQLSRESIAKTLNKMTQTMKSHSNITRAFGYLNYTRREQWYVTCDGTEIEQTFDFWSQDYSCIAEENGEIQRRSFFGGQAMCLQGGLESFDEYTLMQHADRAAYQALELVRAPDCPSEVTNLVLAPDQMLLQIHESIGHPLELDRILGDERNYAGWSFVKLEDFGKLQFGSPLLNVVFNPHAKSGFASYAFDDTGLPAQKEYLIKEGLLLRPLGGTESQIRSGLPGVANMRSSSWNRAPIDRMANIDIEPGETSFESMIANIESGIFMETQVGLLMITAINFSLVANTLEE
jgi:predicted Zn-dependent protease